MATSATELPSLQDWYSSSEYRAWISKTSNRKAVEALKQKTAHLADNALNANVCIWEGDITRLRVDAIVNAANNSLLGGGGVDGAIHRAAGRGLYQECKTLNGCETGSAKITAGYKLPAKAVIHTVGPVGHKPELLKRCYESCLKLCSENRIRSVAFCCVSTGIYGFPNEPAAHIALQTIREYLTQSDNSQLRAIFCVFLPQDLQIYRELVHLYFPPVEHSSLASSSDETDSDEEAGVVELALHLKDRAAALGVDLTSDLAQGMDSDEDENTSLERTLTDDIPPLAKPTPHSALDEVMAGQPLALPVIIAMTARERAGATPPLDPGLRNHHH
ncbi:hypothetical protein HKX48_004412 [Thoreauomyces humboldtii]|nr:hypothetical protein HKX48_004412 [Thoreauomyces humboldtii]